MHAVLAAEGLREYFSMKELDLNGYAYIAYALGLCTPLLIWVLVSNVSFLRSRPIAGAVSVGTVYLLRWGVRINLLSWHYRYSTGPFRGWDRARYEHGWQEMLDLTFVREFQDVILFAFVYAFVVWIGYFVHAERRRSKSRDVAFKKQ